MGIYSPSRIVPWALCLALTLGAASVRSETVAQYGYTGREPDASGLMYYHARYYDAATGHFTQRDPIGLAGGVNDYSYVNGSPIGRTDPSGKGWRDVMWYINDAMVLSSDLGAGLPQGFRDWPVDEQHLFLANAVPIAVTGGAVAASIVGPPLAVPLIWKNGTAGAVGFGYGAINSWLAGGSAAQIAMNGSASAVTAMGLANLGPYVCGNGPSVCMAEVRLLWGAHNAVMQEVNSVAFGSGSLKPVEDLNAFDIASTTLGGHLLMYIPVWPLGTLSASNMIGVNAAKITMGMTVGYLLENKYLLQENLPTRDWTMIYLAKKAGQGILDLMPGMFNPPASSNGPSTP